MNKIEAIEMLKLEESTVSDDCDNFYKGYCSVYEDGCFHQCEKDYISRKQAIEALGEEPEIACDTDKEWAERDAWVIHRNAIASLPPVTPPKRVLAEIKVDTEELIEKIKEEYQPEVSSDCISRQQAIEELQKYLMVDEVTEYDEFSDGEIFGIHTAIGVVGNLPPVAPTVSDDCIDWQEDCEIADFIRNAPSVTPTEKVGEWKLEADCGITKCSQCGWSIEECIDYDYCPNCGAKMKGGK